VPKVALFLAAIILAMAIAQLFHFEDFLPLVDDFSLPGGAVVVQLFATGIVVLEVAALPFLLRMRLSTAMRFVSMVSGWMALMLWMAVQLYLNIFHPEVPNSGLAGLVVEVGVGWWSVFLLAALGTLAAWASWGMWPLARRRK
jgi:hypothetical protein